MINTRLLLFYCLAGAGLVGASCTSSEGIASGEHGGAIRLSLTTNATFGSGTASRAVDESGYADVSRYTVQVLDAGDNSLKKEFLYSEAVTPIELSNGSYILKAFYGTEREVSDKEFYVEGSTPFNIQGEGVENIAVSCTPTCGKVIARFADTMDDYFNDYSVVYETRALSAKGAVATWARTTTDPLYLKVDKDGENVRATIKVVRKSDNKAADIEKTYTLAPNKAWTLNIAPQDNSGNIGIVITIDESTDDHPVDIVVPSDWV